MKKYTFNERGWHRFSFTPRREALKVNAEIFSESIGLPFAYCNERNRIQKPGEKEPYFPLSDIELIDEFITTLFSNADWYNRQVIWEIWKQHIFLVFSIALLFGIPLFVAFVLPNLPTALPEVFGNNPDSAAIITAQVGAVLTSIIALQRTFSAWFGRRMVVGRRWRARAELIGLIYDFENEYKYEFQDISDPREDASKSGKDGAEPTKKNSQPPASLPPKMRRDMKAAIKRARETVEIERQEFFDNYALPEIDVGSSIVSAQAIASKIVTAFRAPLDASAEANRTRVENRLRVEKEYREIEEKVDFLQRKFDRLNSKIGRTKGLRDGAVNAHDQELLSRQVSELADLEEEIGQANDRLLALNIEKHILTQK